MIILTQGEPDADGWYDEPMNDVNGMHQATAAQAPLVANLPIKWFGIMFLVIMAIFLTWYMIMRRRDE